MFRTGIRSTLSCHTTSIFRVSLAVIALAAAAAIAVTPGSALAAPSKGGAANLAMIGEPQTLDPMASTADLVSTIMQHVYEPLYTFDANWNVAPMLAEGMPAISKDGVVYTIPLRKGVKFHNGKEMTSDDVVASIKHHSIQGTKSAAKSLLAAVKDVTADGTETVIFELNGGNADFPYIVSDYHMPIMPKKDDGTADWSSGRMTSSTS